MNQQTAFEMILKRLEKAGIPYMVTGSIAAVIHGEPRLTNDLDIVVEMPAKQVSSLLSEFETESGQTTHNRGPCARYVSLGRGCQATWSDHINKRLSILRSVRKRTTDED